ncbi:cytochrome C [Pedobacter psychrophilus]|uniref:Cytochrome C n=1 Tax=Pedobacter psychrophilus TaxID=1826909 RepID=A0A179DL89_9SPHI|nr:cytochrome c3 family protein [Pedobacter psychrophilus]OAQ41654.1 cytochrome C [Pedobacter psychrophilus]
MRNFSSDFRRFLRPFVIVTAIALGALGSSFIQTAPADTSKTAAPTVAGAAPTGGDAAAAGSTVAGDPKAGEALFKANCTSCHALNKRVLGPALAGINQKYNDQTYLTKWIKNSPAMIASGDKRSVAIYEEYNKAAMTPFPQFSDGDVENILAYIQIEGDKKPDAVAAGATGATTTAESGVSDFMLIGLIAVVIIAFLVILVLNRVIGTLERLLLKKGTDIILIEDDENDNAEPKDRLATVKKLAKNKKLVAFVVIAIIITLGSFGWMGLWNTGVQQGYQPVQPIKFSHQLHAGTNQIQCQYCHSGAWKSKNATIPSLNICMNCHKYVQATEKYNGEISPEISKIYAALDYSPETQKYGDNPRPIEWVRIHNLPDLAYFNHSQHVKVAGIACQKCHGPIQEMQEVYQYSPLTMKWCINCHKQTEVNSKGNPYYDKVIAAHEKIKKGEKVTAAVLGGLECGKCHY